MNQKGNLRNQGKDMTKTQSGKVIFRYTWDEGGEEWKSMNDSEVSDGCPGLSIIERNSSFMVNVKHGIYGRDMRYIEIWSNDDILLQDFVKRFDDFYAVETQQTADEGYENICDQILQDMGIVICYSTKDKP
jgi:hypothetical protein